MTYEQVLEKIHSFSVFGSRLGLHRMRILLGILGDPQEDLNVIHVAGTNGKGSTCRYVYSVLTEAGYRVGAYFSPYVERFTERIECGGREISEEELIKYSERVFDAVDQMLSEGYESPTEFEVVTAVGLLFFADVAADLVVLEVGLGGRGDSTNVCRSPLVTAVTSIDFDHTAVLGNTLPEIAAEKAGIIKPGSPVVSFVKDPAACEVIREKAALENAPFYDVRDAVVSSVTGDISGYSFSASFEIDGISAEVEDLALGMHGMHQVENALCALYILELLKRRGIEIGEEALRKGMAAAKQPVRFEVFADEKTGTKGPMFILDGAHNKAGVESLVRTAKELLEGRKILLCTGILGDKDYREMAVDLAEMADSVIVSGVPVPRGMASSELAECFVSEGADVIGVYEDHREAFDASIEAAGDHDVVIWAGSIYLVGAVRTLLREYMMSNSSVNAEYKRVLLFYNHKSGNGMFQKNLGLIISRFQAKKRLVFPVRADDNISISEVLSQIDIDKYEKIIAAGGDGTINSVVNAMIENEIDLPLGIFPAGTANDFAHYFNMSNDLDAMIDIALDDHCEKADLGWCNGSYFVNVAAIGSVIDVSQKTDTGMKNALGILAYYLQGLRELKFLKPFDVTVTYPEGELKEKIFFMIVLNGDSAGGFRKLGVHSEVNDGLLDVIMFKYMNSTNLVSTGYSVLKGDHDKDKNVIYFQTSELRVESDIEVSTDIDGEPGLPLPLDIKVVPNRIRILTKKEQ